MARDSDSPSFWLAQEAAGPTRPALAGDIRADVCIVGAGFTGLWTAYELRRADPSLDVVVLEARYAGFGASGRNGGWLMGELAGARATWAARHGREAVIDAGPRHARHTVPRSRACSTPRTSSATGPTAARCTSPRRRWSSSASART